MRLLSVRVCEALDRDSVLLEVETDEGSRIAGRVRLAGLSPGTVWVGIDGEGNVGLNLPSPLWQTQAIIPPLWDGVTQAVVPILVRRGEHHGQHHGGDHHEHD